ncbi:hydrogenase small subunit [soil metagenome]
MTDPLAPIGLRSKLPREGDRPKMQLGPLEKLYAFWIVGGSCDGCTIAITGATNPPLEHLLAGIVPGLPRVELIHTVVSVESGAEWVENLRMADAGQLDAPFVVLWEGSVFDERLAGEGYFMGLGDNPETGQPVTSQEWLSRLAPKAAATIAVGTCATWGGIPAAANNPTGSMGVMDFLGKDYRSVFGVPVVNIPGCSPIGDNIMETIAAVVLFLQGLAPLPEFDELGRPAWLFGETVHRHCPRAGYYEEGVFAEEYGGKECLVELGCWGPVVQCNISERGMINGVGGCMNMGGICIGCTMPGFPDKFAPIYVAPPGSMVSSNTSRITGGLIRRMRRASMGDKNRSILWDAEIPSGWARHESKPSATQSLFYKAYKVLQNSNKA